MFVCFHERWLLYIWATVSLPHVLPAFLSSLFPCRLQVRACIVMWLGSLLRVELIQFCFLLKICASTGFWCRFLILISLHTQKTTTIFMWKMNSWLEMVAYIPQSVLVFRGALLRHLTFLYLFECHGSMFVCCFWNDPWDTLACCWDVKQPTNKQIVFEDSALCHSLVSFCVNDLV